MCQDGLPLTRARSHVLGSYLREGVDSGRITSKRLNPKASHRITRGSRFADVLCFAKTEYFTGFGYRPLSLRARELPIQIRDIVVCGVRSDWAGRDGIGEPRFSLDPAHVRVEGDSRPSH